MTAAEVKTALRNRHDAAGQGSMVGEWTCLEELWGIDLLAWSPWGKCERVGYEVKVSRSDYRREVLAPDKRAGAVAMCDRFYFAVPNGLLTKTELAWREPGDLRPGDFERERCPGFDPVPALRRRQPRLFDDDDPGRPVYGGRCRKGTRYDGDGGYHGRGSLHGKHIVTVPIPRVITARDDREKAEGPDEYRVRTDTIRGGVTDIVCPTCAGKGYVAKSRVEQEAPTLWVPADVGLVVVYDSGVSRVVRQAPINPTPEELSARDVAQAVRWASNRPDPRHVLARTSLEAVA